MRSAKENTNFLVVTTNRMSHWIIAPFVL